GFASAMETAKAEIQKQSDHAGRSYRLGAMGNVQEISVAERNKIAFALSSSLAEIPVVAFTASRAFIAYIGFNVAVVSETVI
ncbi:Hypothetical predicted protein, partial [Paramuricea clavata]